LIPVFQLFSFSIRPPTPVKYTQLGYFWINGSIALEYDIFSEISICLIFRTTFLVEKEKSNFQRGGNRIFMKIYAPRWLDWKK